MRRIRSWLDQVRSLVGGAKGGGLRAELLRGGAGAFLVRGAQTLLLFVLTVVLARLLGAEGYGVYAFVLALIQLLGIPAQSGLQALVVREVAAYREDERWAQLRGVLRFGFQTILALSVVIAAVVATVAWLLSERWTPEQLSTLGWGLVLLPILALGNFRGAALRGLKSIVKGLLPENVLRPGGFLLLCGGFWVLARNGALTPSRAMMLHVIAAAVAFVLGTWMLVEEVPREAKQAAPEYRIRQWLVSLGPLSLITAMQVINSRADLVMLGMFSGAEDVGVYRVAAQGGLLVIFGLRAVNLAVAPHFSSFWTAGDTDRLQRLATLGARVGLVAALPVVTLFMLFGDTILGLVFGREFSTGHVALAIISVGQLVNATAGSVVVLLNMTGHERIVVRCLVVAASSNIVMNLILIPIWNIEGAAIATVATFVIWNALLWRAAKREIGIDTMAFGAGLWKSTSAAR